MCFGNLLSPYNTLETENPLMPRPSTVSPPSHSPGVPGPESSFRVKLFHSCNIESLFGDGGALCTAKRLRVYFSDYLLFQMREILLSSLHSIPCIWTWSSCLNIRTEGRESGGELLGDSTQPPASLLDSISTFIFH